MYLCEKFYTTWSWLSGLPLLDRIMWTGVRIPKATWSWSSGLPLLDRINEPQGSNPIQIESRIWYSLGLRGRTVIT